jgi:uracil phosphoribosyltransferase
MLATGGSAIAAVDAIKKWGAKDIKFLGILGAPEGVNALNMAHPDVDIHLCGLDDHLDERGYIYPGLGDAGDRQFNT